MFYVTKELYHHGILGMKWGKRNGPPYPLDPEDHSKSEQKAGWRKSLDGGSDKKEEKEPGRFVKRYAEKYAERYKSGEYKSKEMKYDKDYGDKLSPKMDPESAQKYGMDKAKVLKRIAIGAGVVVGAAVAYEVYRQYGMNFADGIIESGTTIQTLSMDPNRMDAGEAFYTAYRDMDKLKYEAMFGQSTDIFGTPIANKEVIQALVNKDIRIAGRNTGAQVFKQLMENNATFRREAEAILEKAKPYRGIYLLNGRGYMTDYDLFNAFGLFDSSFADSQNTFYSALKKLGYGAVADVNDRKFSGYNTAAAIVFDRNNLGARNVSTLLDSEINSAKVKVFIEQIKEEAIAPASVASGSAFVGSMILKRQDKKALKNYKNQRSTNNSK